MSNTIDLNDHDGLRAAAAALRSSGWLRLATIVEQHIAEVERLRADLDALSRAVGQALVAASLAADETLADPIPHIIVSTVTRLRAEALGQRAEVSYLRACVPPVHPGEYGHEAWAETVRAAVGVERAAVVAWLRDYARQSWTSPNERLGLRIAADTIERGEHLHAVDE